MLLYTSGAFSQYFFMVIKYVNKLHIQSTLVISVTPRDSIKHFEISRTLDISELRNLGKQLIEQPPLTE